jgi:predicted  nucleic acid-binding Zn-ribbon protein
MDALEQRDGGGIDPASRQRELATLMRVLGQLEDRVSRMEESAGALAEQGHAEVEQIQALSRRVMNALNELGEHANSVKRWNIFIRGNMPKKH